MHRKIPQDLLRLSLNPELIWKRLHDRIAILPLDESEQDILEVDGDAVDFWDLLGKSANVEEALAKYAVAFPDRELDEDAIEAFLREMESYDFLR